MDLPVAPALAIIPVMMEPALFAVEHAAPWLLARFPHPMRLAGWSLNRPGFTQADKVAWLEVRHSDLPPEVDPLALLDGRLAAQGWSDAAGMMTACEIRHYHRRRQTAPEGVCEMLLTLGLGNAVRFDEAGQPAGGGTPIGTINALIALSMPLTDGAMMELIGVASSARAAALLTAGDGIVGTGTDCLIIAAPPGETPRPFAGLHTAIGRMVAAATYQAVRQAQTDWLSRQAGPAVCPSPSASVATISQAEGSPQPR